MESRNLYDFYFLLLFLHPFTITMYNFAVDIYYFCDTKTKLFLNTKNRVFFLSLEYFLSHRLCSSQTTCFLELQKCSPFFPSLYRDFEQLPSFSPWASELRIKQCCSSESQLNQPLLSSDVTPNLSRLQALFQKLSWACGRAWNGTGKRLI